MEIALRCGSCLRGGRDRPRLSRPRLRPRSSTRVDAPQTDIDTEGSTSMSSRGRAPVLYTAEAPRQNRAACLLPWYMGVWRTSMGWSGSSGGAGWSLSSPVKPPRAVSSHAPQHATGDRSATGNRRQRATRKIHL
ncbi:hypothetical protein HETIRDRAFT_441033 [Heterobasidion irregulare TC 32-1]|uniref:Uncharacterized protein n=1 Tax=Heterobasidion irregulare (strain TC 32-1) TaxID=747525 RepID=W4JZ52_HETIT|nr:uncharacterized protein HETIRDRAFT_441033 [Heterobasidion irregulare TC 32-1]ETW78754.1 hypothetical protein HETIRDRAFT_441033 [Heterobasidion irregulare TC 32-1]